MDRLSTFIAFCVLFSVALAHGQLQVLNVPESIVLRNTSQSLSSSDYSKFVALCLAYSSEKPSNFDGFYGYKNFANIPHSVVTFHIPISVEPIASQSFSLDDNADIENQYDAISHLMLSKYDNSFAEKVALYKTNAGNSLQDQIDSLNAYLDQLSDLKTKNLLPQRLSLWFDFVSEAKTNDLSLNKFNLQLQEAVKKVRSLLDDKVLIVSIVNQDLHVLKRSARATSVINAQGKADDADHNLAYAYDVDYHVAFTTIGFTTILLLLTVFGVSVAMWNIEDRDSIIYRLTSQKIKKDQ